MVMVMGSPIYGFWLLIAKCTNIVTLNPQSPRGRKTSLVGTTEKPDVSLIPPPAVVNTQLVWPSGLYTVIRKDNEIMYLIRYIHARYIFCEP